jgi:hypothetical protein
MQVGGNKNCTGVVVNIKIKYLIFYISYFLQMFVNFFLLPRINYQLVEIYRKKFYIHKITDHKCS